MQARQGKHSKQRCKRYRAKTVTANSKASATRQTAPQLQPAPPRPALLASNHRPSWGTSNTERETHTKVIDGEGAVYLAVMRPPLSSPLISAPPWFSGQSAVLRLREV